MEKSGKLIMTQEEYSLFTSEGIISESLKAKGIDSESQLIAIINSEEFEIL